jgi:hypothetical protein
MTITGDLKVMLDALGARFGDAAVLEAMVLVGLPTERSEYRSGTEASVYYIAERKSAEFLFENDLLEDVTVRTVADEEHGAYPTPDTLIEGLSGTATRTQTRAFFGDPEWSSASADRFKVDGGFVWVGYAEDRIAEISVMRTAPAGVLEAPEAAPTAEPTLDRTTVPPPGGEITTYLAALGLRPDDPALTPVLDLPGPTTDHSEHRQADGNIEFHLAARTSGTEFMFSHERLVAVLIGTQPRPAWDAYPRPDQLIEGLSGTATREEVRARFGRPVWEKESSDRFEVGGNYLQFEYHDGRIQVVVAAVGERA